MWVLGISASNFTGAHQSISTVGQVYQNHTRGTLCLQTSGAWWLCGRTPDSPTISFTPFCLCLLEEIIKAVGPFYLVSMSLLPGVYVPSTWCLCPFYLVSMQGEVKYLTQGVNAPPPSGIYEERQQLLLPVYGAIVQLSLCCGPDCPQVEVSCVDQSDHRCGHAKSGQMIVHYYTILSITAEQ